MSLKLKQLIIFMLVICAYSTHAAVNNKQNESSAPPTDALQLQTNKPVDASQLSIAQQQRLDMLFVRLAGSDNEGTARQLIAEIWSIWKSPLNTELLLQMTQAEQLFRKGKREQAFIILDTAVQNHPGYSEIWNQRATYYYFDGRYEDSLNDIAKVLELEPRHFGAMSGKIAILMRESRMESALKTLRQALKVNPFMPERHMLSPRPEKKAAPKGLAI